MNSAPLVTVHTVCKSQIAIGRKPDQDPDLRNTSLLSPKDVFLVELMSRDRLDDGPCVDSGSVWSDLSPAGINSLCDPTRDSITELHCASGCLSFYLLNAALDEVAAASVERRIRALYLRDGRVLDDPVMRSLCQVL